MVLGGASLDSNVFIEVEVVLLSSEEGTSGFLSCSDMDLGMCLQFQTGSQVSICVEALNSAFLSSCKRGFRPPVELN